MLHVLRQRWFAAVFIAAVAGVLILYLGIGGGGRRAPGAVVIVGEEVFGRPEFNRARAQRQQILEQQLGSEFDARAFEDTVDQLAVRSLIEGAVLSQEASALGMTVSKREIERLIRASASFTGEGGRFDPELFDGWVQYEFGNHRNFIRHQRAAMLAGKLMRTLAGLAEVSEGEAREAVVRRLEEIQIAFLALGGEIAPADFEPAPEALEAFLASRENELRALYEERSRLYNLPEQVRARHILLSLAPEATAEDREAALARAEQVLERVRAGEDFAEVAREVSEDPGSRSEGGDLGFFGRGQMVGAFENAAFSREPGAIGELVETEYGFHVLRVEEHREAQQRSYEDVREELAAEMMGREVARTESRARAEKLAEAVRNGARLEDAVRADGLTLQRTERLKRRGDGYIPNLGASPELMAAAFSLDPGESSDRVFEVGNSQVLIQVIDRFPPAEADVEAAIEQERIALENQKQQAYLTTWVNRATARLEQEGEIVVNLESLRGG